MDSSVDILAEAGNMHASDITLLIILIISAGFITYFILMKLNRKKPPEERRSNLALFLISLNVSFFVVVTFFVYKVLIAGLKYLMSNG
ncbi:hypothetical protein [Persephonella sp.]